MKVVWALDAWDDYQHWQKHNSKVARAINDLVRDIARDPFKGLGKPEPLKHALQGFWSRRITREDRLVYRVTGARSAQVIEIVQCRYHY